MKITGVSRRGVQGVLKKNREEGCVDTKERSGRPVSKATQEVKDRIRKKVARNPKWTIAQLARDENMSRKTMSKVVASLGLKSK